MTRIARVVAVGLPHHVTQRGNYGQDVFRDDSDRKRYLSWIQEYSDRYGLSILVYCLMRNHVHFIAVPNSEDSLAKTFNTTHMRYSQYFNRKMQKKGHLWQARFYSCVLDQPHLITAARYVERNPVRANMAEKLWEWRWSSALVHIGNGKALVELNDLLGIVDMSHDSWKQYIGYGEDGRSLDEIRRHTLTGRPLGEVTFVENMEKKFGRKLFPSPRGRRKRERK